MELVHLNHTVNLRKVIKNLNTTNEEIGQLFEGLEFHNFGTKFLLEKEGLVNYTSLISCDKRKVKLMIVILEFEGELGPNDNHIVITIRLGELRGEGTRRNQILLMPTTMPVVTQCRREKRTPLAMCRIYLITP